MAIADRMDRGVGDSPEVVNHLGCHPNRPAIDDDHPDISLGSQTVAHAGKDVKPLSDGGTGHAPAHCSFKDHAMMVGRVAARLQARAYLEPSGRLPRYENWVSQMTPLPDAESVTLGDRSTHPDWRGVHHLALVTPDMDATVRFYVGVLGMPLVATLRAGPMRHYFFELGPGNTIAFFEVPDAETFSKPAGAPSSRAIQFDHVSFAVDD